MSQQKNKKRKKEKKIKGEDERRRPRDSKRDVVIETHAKSNFELASSASVAVVYLRTRCDLLEFSKHE